MATPIWEFDFYDITAPRQIIEPIYNRDGEYYEFADVKIKKSVLANGAYAIVMNCTMKLTEKDPPTACIVRVFQSRNFLDGHREAMFAKYCEQKPDPTKLSREKKVIPPTKTLDMGPVIFRRYKVKPNAMYQSFFDDIMRTNKAVGGSLNPYNYLELDIMQKLDITLFEYLVNKGIEDTQFHLTFVNLSKFVANGKVISDFMEKIQSMHKNLIVHCDLHYKNIMCTVDKQGYISRLYAIDYGLGMFNDRVSEPRFEPYNMNTIYGHSKRMTTLFLPETTNYQLEMSDVVADVSNFDEWFLEGLRFAQTFIVTKWNTLINKMPSALRENVPIFAEDFGAKQNPKREYFIPGPNDFTETIPLPAPEPTAVVTKTTEQLNLWPFFGKRIIDIDTTRKRRYKSKEIAKMLTEYHKYFKHDNFQKTIEKYFTEKNMELINGPDEERQKFRDLYNKKDGVLPEIFQISDLLFENSREPPANQIRDIETYPKMNYLIKAKTPSFNFGVFDLLLEFFVFRAIEKLNGF